MILISLTRVTRQATLFNWIRFIFVSSHGRTHARLYVSVSPGFVISVHALGSDSGWLWVSDAHAC